MMPVRFIAERAQAARVLDLEEVGALLDHHDLKICVSNQFSSDCGDRWSCDLARPPGETVIREQYAPTLREAVLKALTEAERVLEAERKVRKDLAHGNIQGGG